MGWRFEIIHVGDIFTAQLKKLLLQVVLNLLLQLFIFFGHFYCQRHFSFQVVFLVIDTTSR
jgi:hypothetical protein